jgi:hypothetical protein
MHGFSARLINMTIVKAMLAYLCEEEVLECFDFHALRSFATGALHPSAGRATRDG